MRTERQRATDRAEGRRGRHATEARTIEEIARAVFGWKGLRTGQEEGIRAALAGRDAQVVMPTGSGKSAIYQIAATLLDGPTVVISPLIALQRDQVEGLEERGAGGAALGEGSRF